LVRRGRRVHGNYIVAQTSDSLIIVDQHAAHERLVYEALKMAMHSRPLPAQMLLLPEIVDLPADDVERLAMHADTLARFGLRLERFGPGAVAVQETPAMLGEADVQGLIRDLADEIADSNDTVDTRERLDRVASTMACPAQSARAAPQAGRDERIAAPDGGDPGSATCNHGRPTYIS
jgi:DNA mismatch repair protein MutL